MGLQMTAAVGLLGAILMFCGDMLLYFTGEEYALDGTYEPYLKIMEKLPPWRLKFGGLLGPVAAFFYCIGYAGVWLAATEAFKIPALMATLLFCLGIVVGGAYHSHFTYLGLLGTGHGEGVRRVLVDNTMFLSKVSTLLIAIASLILAGLVVFGKTIYPPWFVVFTPVILIWCLPLWRKLPQPFRIVLSGGWNNLLFVIFFSAMLLFSM